MNYAIFRSEPIYTTNDLAQIGSHNKREKKAYNSNPNINLEKTKDNFELVPLNNKYLKGFYELTKEYKKEHEERMKTEREDRKRSYKKMLDDSKNVVADEMIFTASHDFFKNMSKDDIKKWADKCMEFVYEDLGYSKDQILHATVHMDEETPHIHCVAVPLIRKFDKRTNTERLTISKKQYIKDKEHLSELQDKYCKRLNEAGFILERGIKNSDVEHIKIKEFKKITNNLNKQLKNREEKLEKAINELEEKMKSNKSVIFDKESVKIKKDTFESMNTVIEETKKLSEIKDKMNEAYEDMKKYADDYSEVVDDNFSLLHEIDNLNYNNQNYEDKINSLEFTLKHLSAGMEGMINFVYDLMFEGYVPKKKEEDFFKEFQIFLNGKNKKEIKKKYIPRAYIPRAYIPKQKYTKSGGLSI